MTEIEKPSHKVPFPAFRGGRDFEKAFQVRLKEAVDKRIGMYISAENSHSMYHGLGWTHQRKDDSAAQGEITRHSVVGTLETRDVVAHDLSIMTRVIGAMVEQVGEQAEKELFGMISTASEGVGNVVKRQPGMSVIDMVLAMMAKVELVVGRDGKISLPQVHLSPEDMATLREEVRADEEGFKQRMDAIIGEKAPLALASERERVGRFRKREE